MAQIFHVIWLALSTVVLLVPANVSQHFCSDLDINQARLFGVEGRPRLSLVESLMLGASCGGLKWSSDCVTEQSPSREHVGNSRLFTLINTQSQTATTFKDLQPPSLVFVGASEQGVLRALLCSYDLASRSSMKESVIRLESTALESMQSLDRSRFSIP